MGGFRSVTCRSFNGMVDDLDTLSTHVSNYAARCAEKLRAQHSVAAVVGVEDGEGNIEPASAERAFVEADVVWVVGEEASVRSLLKAHALPA